MLKRKESRSTHSRSSHREKRGGSNPVRRRFVLPSAKRKAQEESAPKTNGQPAIDSGKSNLKAPPATSDAQPAARPPHGNVVVNPLAGSVDLTETVKTLLHLAQEHGYVTYDDINDVLPDGLNPEDLDELFTKLRSLDVEIVDQAEAERTAPKPSEPEEADEDEAYRVQPWFRGQGAHRHRREIAFRATQGAL